MLELTSEVENLLSGQVEKKTQTFKAIGVATSNLQPDEKGIVPLSKQSAFSLKSQIASAPAKETIETPEVTEELDLGVSSLKESVDLTPSKVEEPANNEAVSKESTPLVDSNVVNDDVIKDLPVEVASPSSLDSLDINSIIPEIPLVNDTPVVEEKPKEEPAIELPEMPETILAEEPTKVDDNLFVNTEPTTSVESVDLPSEIVPIEGAPEVVKESVEPVSSIATEAPSTEDVKNEEVDKTTVETQSSTEVAEESIFSNVGNNDASPSKDESQEQQVVQNKNSEKVLEKFDQLFVKLDQISASLNGIVEKLDSMEMKEASVLNVSNDVKSLEENVGKLEDVVDDLKKADVDKSELPSIEPAKQQNESSDSTLPTIDNNQNDMVDALSQLNNMDIPIVDETPIKGGMFI